MADLDLARRAMRAAGWVWRRPERVVAIGDGRLVYRDVERGVLWVDVAPPGVSAEWLPDLNDGATLGCMLALVRERWGDPCIFVAHTAAWYIAVDGGRQGFHGATEAEALVVTLERDSSTWSSP